MGMMREKRGVVVASEGLVCGVGVKLTGNNGRKVQLGHDRNNAAVMLGR